MEVDPLDNASPVTRSELASALRRAGVRAGGILMVHTKMSAIGWVVGGQDTVVLALQDVLGDAGTLMVYTCWEHDAFHFTDWPEARRAAYLREPPVFDPACSPGWTGSDGCRSQSGPGPPPGAAPTPRLGGGARP